MGGKVWSDDEERVFWSEIIPASTKRNLFVESHGQNAKGWSDLCQTMQRAMGRKARRKYTGLMLYEHFFQNSVLERFSPNAAKYVRAYIRSEKTISGTSPSDRGRSTNRHKQRGSGSGRRPKSIAFDDDLKIVAARAVNNLREAQWHGVIGEDGDDASGDPEYPQGSEEPEKKDPKQEDEESTNGGKSRKSEPDDLVDMQSVPRMAQAPMPFLQPGNSYPTLPLPVPTRVDTHPLPSFPLPPLTTSRYESSTYYNPKSQDHQEPLCSYQTLAPYTHPPQFQSESQYASQQPYTAHAQSQSMHETAYRDQKEQQEHMQYKDEREVLPWFSAIEPKVATKPEPLEPQQLEPGVFPGEITQ